MRVIEIEVESSDELLDRAEKGKAVNFLIPPIVPPPTDWPTEAEIDAICARNARIDKFAMAIRALMDASDYEAWSFRQYKGCVFCELTLHGITRSHVGTAGDTEIEKCVDALRNAARMFEFAR